MIANARTIVALTSLLLSVVAGQALAADSPPRMDMSCATPNYRTAWQDEEQQGDVKLAVLVGADGNVREAKVIESSGYTSLDKASLRALAKCKYQPGFKDGAAAAAWTKVHYSWVIN